MNTILVAACPAATDAINSALGKIASTITAHTFEAATDIIEQGVDILVAGVYFDGARMFELLRHVRDLGCEPAIPMICVRAASAPDLIAAETSQPVIASFNVVESASRALGAVGYVDLVQRQAAIGTAAANAELKWLVRSQLPP